MAGVNGIEIKVGQVWRTRGGEMVTVSVRDGNDTSYPWCVLTEGGDEMWVTNSGRDYESLNRDDDLIELVKDVTTQPADSATLAEETLSALGWTFDGQAWTEQPKAEFVVKDGLGAPWTSGPRVHIEMLDTAVSAPALLSAAAKHMNDRAGTYDKPEGERSMAQTVAVFKAFHGIALTESQGWHFMQTLKDVRLFTRDGYHADSAEDCIAYAALKAEAKAQEGGA